jgi:hypothetical protein
MMSKEIRSGNEVIAEFMELPHANQTDNGTLYSHTDWEGGEWAYFADDLCYQKSWDWLMPVVEKIEGYGFSVFIHNDGCYIKPTYYFGNFPAIGNIGDSKIGATYKAVLAFINWYNTKS